MDAIRAADNLELVTRSEVRAGAYDEAMSGLEQLVKIPSNVSVPMLRVDPWFDPLRQNPRFQRLVGSH